MSLSTRCGNCGQAKDPSEYANPYCQACTAAIKEAREGAVREGADVSAAQRNALLRRCQHVNANRWDPRVPYERQGSFNIAGLGENSKPTPGFGAPDGNGPVQH